MKNLSIKTINPNSKISFSNTSSFDINSLMTINNSYEDSIRNFSADNLIKHNKEKREKLLNIYNKYYAQCIEKIQLYNNAGKFDLIFEIPDKIIDNVNYIPLYCLEFIETKLKDNFLDTYKINNNTIFITWKYIESNKK
jgi:hypothetical protein